ncbi:MAG TPA: FtsX-like permease family protein, partial [Devosia sp.]|nr:FtsX-like permease family protein [Devosia sp.]
MNRLGGWMRVGLSDLRGDMRRFGILIACLALGTGVIAAVGSVGAGFVQAVERDATTMMGGDLGAALSERAANAEELDFLQSLGEITHVVDTTARGVAGENTVFLDLLAVDENYPLRGEVKSPQLLPGQKPDVLLVETNGIYGAIVDPVLLDRLGLDLGERFFIGQAEFEIRGTLISVPDSAVRGFQLGLTTLIPTKALEKIGELRSPMPGLLTHYRYKIILDELTYEEAAAAIAQRFDDEEWEVRSPREAAGDLVHFYDLFSRFLMIVGLSSLLVGGVGVSNGVSAYISERQRSIATLRSLGATGPRILVHFLTQIGVLTLVGVALGVAFGAIASLILLPFVGNAININLPALIDFPSLLTAAGFGILAGFAFSYLPLMRAQKVSPALLFRSLGATMPQTDWRTMLKVQVVVPILIAGGGIFWLAVLTTNRLSLVAYYTLGVIASFVLLRGSGWLLQQGLRKVPPIPLASVRNALRNIYHPGSSAPVVIVSIGMGLAMLLVIALLNNNLQSQLLGAVSRDAPTFVALDLFPDEVEALKRLSQQDENIVEFQSSAMLSGSVSKVNGVDAATLTDVGEEAMFLLSGEIPLTGAREMPPATTAIEGEWWPADYDGPQLVSLRQTIKSQLGVKVGDTIQF